jgi:hypothetical protein
MLGVHWPMQPQELSLLSVNRLACNNQQLFSSADKKSVRIFVPVTVNCALCTKSTFCVNVKSFLVIKQEEKSKLF